MRTWEARSFREGEYELFYGELDDLDADFETVWVVGKVDMQFIVDACNERERVLALADHLPEIVQHFRDTNAAETAREQHCLSCGGLKGAHLGRCQPFEDLFSAMYRETFGVDRPSATPRAPFTQEYAAQEQPMTMAERQTRETGFLVKDL